MFSFLTSKVKRDALRQVAMLVLSMFAIIPMWEASQVVLYFIGVLALLGMGVHLMRIIFFPNISMDELAVDTRGNPLARAIVFFSLTLFICTLFFTASQMVGLK